MKRTLATLAGIAALGIGCAKDVPVYDQTELFAQGQGMTVYQRVRSDAETLALSLFTGDQNREEARWTRYEPANSTQCLKKELYLEGNGETLTFVDDGCDNIVDSALYQGMTLQRGIDFGADVDAVFVQAEADFDSIFGLENQINQWHARKGFKSFERSEERLGTQ
ncbi:MAG: hypothetical protein PHO02_06025 [Candidatus Nanoarchaeia archaeon]|nr:hypothetical protein [Candidatus Nanoarchaeia archaeon]